MDCQKIIDIDIELRDFNFRCSVGHQAEGGVVIRHPDVTCLQVAFVNELLYPHLTHQLSSSGHLITLPLPMADDGLSRKWFLSVSPMAPLQQRKISLPPKATRSTPPPIGQKRSVRSERKRRTISLSSTKPTCRANSSRSSQWQTSGLECLRRKTSKPAPRSSVKPR